MTALAAVAVVTCVVALALRVRPRPRPRGQDARGSDVDDGDGPLRVLEDVDRDLRTGVGLHLATDSALRRHPATLVSVRQALSAGGALTTALAAARPTGAAELLVVQTLRTCERTGGRMGAAVDRAVLVLRERRAWERERHAQAAQARLSATVLTLVPVVFAAWGIVTSERIRVAYTTTPACAIATALGLVVNVVGWLWMRRLVAGVAS